MNDPFLSRDWADRHGEFSDGVARGLRRLVAVVRVSLDRVHAYEFDAPWQRRRQPARRGGLA